MASLNQVSATQCCIRQYYITITLLTPGFAPRSVHVGFVVDKVTLEQVFLRVLRVSPVNIIPPSFSIFIDQLGFEQYARDSSSET
jgi:hypothetical protein